jgi:hypothetical protein
MQQNQVVIPVVALHRRAVSMSSAWPFLSELSRPHKRPERHEIRLRDSFMTWKNFTTGNCNGLQADYAQRVTPH